MYISVLITHYVYKGNSVIIMWLARYIYGNWYCILNNGATYTTLVNIFLHINQHRSANTDTIILI